ncbi:hypothetical protein [Alistipes sp.]|uniref:hypothetical protein n=1 Tax=Alistipes sp. TaxID=1872444 RepID=UPI003AEF99EE
MRKIKNWILVLACGALLAGCSDDDNHAGPLPDEQTLHAFEQQFPDAQNVVWGKKLGYDVASFSLAGTRAAAGGPNSAWYPEGGTVCTYTSFEITWAQLLAEAPAVAQAWEASTYKAEGYRLDDVDVRTYAGSAPTYKLEIERGESEYELVYDRAGTLLFERPDIDEDEDDDDDPCPQPIYDFIATNLPGVQIVDTDTEYDGGVLYYEVEVRRGAEELDLIFDAECRFLYQVVEVDERDYAKLPEAVYQKFLTLAADPEMWEDVAIRQDLQGKVICYVLVVEDERTGREVAYLVDADGGLIG